MKAGTFIHTLTSVLILAVSCQDLYYMPFKETEEGKGAASLYFDGEPFRTHDDRDVKASRSETSFSMDFSCGSELHGSDQINVSVTIVTDTEHPITEGVEYRVLSHDEPSSGEYPQVSVSVIRGLTKGGTIIFRKYGIVVAGNFELTLEDTEGNPHSIRYGNFDVKCELID